jgi:hypothetical protein
VAFFWTYLLIIRQMLAAVGRVNEAAATGQRVLSLRIREGFR